jgi:hypothetical protein
MKIGKAQYETKKRKNYFSIKEGSNLFRILPPLGNLADKSKWAVYYSVHYGYFNSEKKMKPFASPEWRNPKTKVIEIRDAAKDRIKEMKKALEDAKKSGDIAVVKALKEMLKIYNLSSHWYMNAINTNNEIGLLKIRHKAKLALDAEIRKLVAMGIDPTSVDQGRFFEFSRIGSGPDTVYSVRVATEKVNVPGYGIVENERIHVLDESIIARLDSEAFELDRIFPRPTEEEVRAIVEGDKIKNYTAIDAILGVKQMTDEESLHYEEEPEDSSEESAPVQAASTSSVASTPQVESKSVEAPKTVTKTIKVEDTRTPEEILASLGL